MPQTERHEPESSPTLWQTVSSVAASFFGVQSSKARKRDFTHGKAAHFIVIGVVLTVLLILTIVLAVRFALRSAGM